MQITFYGAAREVTGSMHLITTDSDRILMAMVEARSLAAARSHTAK